MPGDLPALIELWENAVKELKDYHTSCLPAPDADGDKPVSGTLKRKRGRPRKLSQLQDKTVSNTVPEDKAQDVVEYSDSTAIPPRRQSSRKIIPSKRYPGIAALIRDRAVINSDSDSEPPHVSHTNVAVCATGTPGVSKNGELQSSSKSDCVDTPESESGAVFVGNSGQQNTTPENLPETVAPANDSSKDTKGNTADAEKTLDLSKTQDSVNKPRQKSELKKPRQKKKSFHIRLQNRGSKVHQCETCGKILHNMSNLIGMCLSVNATFIQVHL